MYGATLNSTRRTSHSWQALWVFSAYRMGLATLLMLLHVFGSPYLNLMYHQDPFYGKIILVYLVFAALCLPFIYRRSPQFELQVVLQVFVDIILLTLLIGVGGDVNHDLGVFINIVIAGGSLLTAGRISLLFAAMATVAIFAEQLSLSLANNFVAAEYFAMGQLGVTFFITAILAHILTKRLQRSESMTVLHEQKIAELARLNSRVLEKIQSGIIVVSLDGQVKLCNQAVKNLFAYHGADALELSALTPELKTIFQAWHHDQKADSALLKLPHLQRELMVQMIPLRQDEHASVLIFIDDDSRMRQQAQAMKLASMGRLSASIAHEIRNPLAAISHAAQLLEESEQLDNREKRFLEIIHNHCTRMNRVINSVLSISRREASRWSEFDLVTWLHQYTRELMEANPKARLDLSLMEEQALICSDKTQLTQILNNLCDNGLRYSEAALGHPVLMLQLGMTASGEIYIDVIDQGPGVSLEQRQSLFEPFYTTHEQGTGLGLYIAKELAEVNRIRLSYRDITGLGACFRLIFSEKR